MAASFRHGLTPRAPLIMLLTLSVTAASLKLWNNTLTLALQRVLRSEER
jgi:hypothetical protein